MSSSSDTVASTRHRRVALRSAKDPWDVVSPGRTLRRNVFRNNVGNLVFSQAAHRALSTSRTVVESNRFAIGPREADRINEQADVFVVPLANAFRPSFRDPMRRLTDLIERLTVPVVVLGVGAQGTAGYDAERLRPIETEVKRFVGAVLDRSPSIGVRGAFTADYLADLGFRDVEVIGCPSMFMWGADLPVPSTPAALDETAKVSVGISPYRTAIGPFISRQLATYPDLTYLPQDLDTLRLLLHGERSSATPAQDAEIPQHLSHRLFTEDKTLFFCDPTPWLDHLRTRDLYVGTRIHGTMMALLAGTPGVLVAHDSRTRELAEHHRIPFVRIKNVSAKTRAVDLYADADYTAMTRTHPDRLRTYLAFLDRHNLDHVFRDGESPRAFDDKIAAAGLPDAVRAPSRSRQYAQRVVQRSVAAPSRLVLAHFASRSDET